MGNNILIVEDENCGEDYQEFFEKCGEDVVFLYRDGEKLVDDLQYGLDYDIAIVDRSLPGSVNGDEVIKQLKNKYSEKQVICISCYGSMKARTTKADKHLEKPFEFYRLEQLVNEILK